MMRNGFKWILLASFCLGAYAFGAEDTRIIGYFPYWAHYSEFYPKDVRYDWVTHIHYGYFVPDESGELAIADDADQENFETLAKTCQEKKVKLLVSIGGPGNADAMHAASSDNTVRDRLVGNILELVKQYHLSGVEVDWQPASEDKGAYGSFLSALADKFSQESPRLLLSATVTWADSLASGYDADALEKADYLTVQALDVMDENQPSVMPNASLPLTEKALALWEDKGIPSGKLVPVVPF
ncbi:MAG TPA: glycoside hydrolase family 18 protein, partial [Fibrobacteraceae bacterium]|nr:glycoside hydrolase family 18 protein [Fibrobacteraceae bacterium]